MEVRFWCLVLVFALGFVLPAPAPVAAAITAPYSSLGSHPIAPGVARDWGTVTGSAGRQRVNVVEVDPFQSGIHFRTSLAADRVTARRRTTA
ncbi:MAG TPA: hypothetical protein VK992_01920, partial [Candidatus Caenarcaniphilales bacterium]|nr:hypothetical protein [Candidatus Caenarcaniphilales bacterium]